MIRRLLVVSHPAVVPANQEVYRELASRGLDVTIVVPSRWRHDYSTRAFPPVGLPGFEDRLLPLRVAWPGKPQRHLHLARLAPVIALTRPDVAFIEAEPYALVAAQWARSLSAHRVRFGVQCYENIDRPLPAPVRILRRAVLTRAAFVVARSDTAADLVRAWGARGRVSVIPPAVPSWGQPPSMANGRPFTIGYAGRLVPEKGLPELLAAVRRLEPPVELLLAGDGELRSLLDGQPIPGSRVRILTGLRHHDMADVYAQMDVLVLPSRTTARWKEQFGRVVVEAMSCGVPVVGSESGEIPGLIERTGGGVTFPEGDVDGLAARLSLLRGEPQLRASLGAKGRSAVERSFTVPVIAEALHALLESAQ